VLLLYHFDSALGTTVDSVLTVAGVAGIGTNNIGFTVIPEFENLRAKCLASSTT